MIKTLLVIIALAVAVPSSAQRKTKTTRKAKVEKTVKTRAQKLFDEMKDNTQSIIVVDSVVVDFDKMLSVVGLSPEQGRVLPYSEFFSTSSDIESPVFVNGFGNKCYYASNEKGKISLYTRIKLGDDWTRPEKLEGLSVKADTLGYPFMKSDGQTFYFSAKSSDGLGGYDIYMTRYDADNGRFYQPENVGLPINSEGNDCLYIEDETNNLAWFATDRRQPKGKVCVYTLIPPTTRTNYDAEEMSADSLNRLAHLYRIRDTWTDKNQVAAAKERIELSKISNKKAEARSKGDIFVVNDNHIISSAEECSSSKSRLLFKSIMDTRHEIKELNTEIESLRYTYHTSTTNQKKQLSTRILDAEKKQKELKAALKKQETELREIER